MPTIEDVRSWIGQDLVKGAPNIEEDHDLSETEEAQLYEHYGLAYGGGYEGVDHESIGYTDHASVGDVSPRDVSAR